MELEEIDKRNKGKEEEKEKQKEACVKVRESRMVEKKAWEEALEGWKSKREAWDEMCVQLKEDTCQPIGNPYINSPKTHHHSSHQSATLEPDPHYTKIFPMTQFISYWTILSGN